MLKKRLHCALSTPNHSSCFKRLKRNSPDEVYLSKSPARCGHVFFAGMYGDSLNAVDGRDEAGDCLAMA
jgi:hypothetical protein